MNVRELLEKIKGLFIKPEVPQLPSPEQGEVPKSFAAKIREDYPVGGEKWIEENRKELRNKELNVAFSIVTKEEATRLDRDAIEALIANTIDSMGKNVLTQLDIATLVKVSNSSQNLEMKERIEKCGNPIALIGKIQENAKKQATAFQDKNVEGYISVSDTVKEMENEKVQGR